MAQEKKRKTPREKKELEYTRDHVNVAEYPDSFRKSWPLKEARSKRAYRRSIRQLSAMLPARSESDFLEGLEPEDIRLEPLKKWPVISIGEKIQRQAESRLVRTAWNYFKAPYDTNRSHERFARFLASQINGRSEQSRALAHLFGQALDGYSADSRGWDWRRRHDWLQAFFNDEPAWEQRLREWVDSFTDD